MIALIDTNVVLDIVLNRQPYYENAAIIFRLSKKNLIKSYISASAITDIFYITQKEQGKAIAKEALKRTFKGFYPATVTDSDIYQAVDLDWEDFEDSVQYIVGDGLSVDYIVTRNTKDFTLSTIKAVTPEQFIQIITDIEN
jgi:predicted nucleic acid-binding protein